MELCISACLTVLLETINARQKHDSPRTGLTLVACAVDGLGQRMKQRVTCEHERSD